MIPLSSRNAGNSSDKPYKGVYQRKPGQWSARVCLSLNTKPRIRDCPDPLWLGYFDSKEKAARAYDMGMVCVFGSQPDVLQRLHFPNTPPALSYPEDKELTVDQVRGEARRHANRDGTEPVQPAQDTVPISARPSASHQFFDFMGVEKSAPEPNVVDPTSNQIEGASPSVERFYNFMGVEESPPEPKELNNAGEKDQDFNPYVVCSS
ncbi:hypothetical protein LUZ61_018327 [Rhynchospora tenuis]|uniref:AP2/ERF domain-containing protein n=1 Tax=Rhynchospora tenuis TaxID=198213 RepID=A0AAD6ELU9_9POAL|nr:hypothetical protein LUZ61_018327 [Rhynchospora tenuis]